MRIEVCERAVGNCLSPWYEEGGSTATIEFGGVDQASYGSSSGESVTQEFDFANLEPSSDSDELRLTVSTTGMAKVRVDSVTVRKDSDGDGLWDRQEQTPFRTMRFGLVDTAIHEDDTDGDGIADDEELGQRRTTTYGRTEYVYYALNSHPNDVDGDGDGIADLDENEKYTIPVVTKTGASDPYRHDYACTRYFGGLYFTGCDDSGETIEVTSNPIRADTDFDGLDDAVERYQTHTDPEAEVTYGITKYHEEQLQAAIETEGGSAYRVAAIGAAQQGDTPEDVALTDASDSFDFVTTETGNEGWDRLRFTALDGTERTDTWVSNADEVAYNRQPGPNLSIWDPDTDDDGLTDGQELSHLTSVYEPMIAAPGTGPAFSIRDDTLETNATDPDTDGDGYWDGWVGVYGVGNTDNVVLYRHHLHDDDDGDGITTDDGVQGDERVDAQTGIHPANVNGSTASATSATFGNQQYHSNIHVGELTFGTDPTVKDSTTGSNNATPDTSRVYEVDYYAGADSQLKNTAWLRAVENNYRLYGIDVSLERDETLTDTDLTAPEYCDSQPLRDCSIPDDGFATTEIAVIASDYAKEPSDEYIFIADKPTESMFLNKKTQWGINLPTSQIGVYSSNLNSSTGRVPANAVNSSEYQSELGFLTSTLLMHEIGHSYDIGRADDRLWEVPKKTGEIYSGADGNHSDWTPEYVLISNIREKRWSVMRRGWNDQAVINHRSNYYFAFSIEEVTTANP